MATPQPATPQPATPTTSTTDMGIEKDVSVVGQLPEEGCMRATQKCHSFRAQYSHRVMHKGKSGTVHQCYYCAKYYFVQEE